MLHISRRRETESDANATSDLSSEWTEMAMTSSSAPIPKEDEESKRIRNIVAGVVSGLRVSMDNSGAAVGDGQQPGSSGSSGITEQQFLLLAKDISVGAIQNATLQV